MGSYRFDIVHYWVTTSHLSEEEDLTYRRLLDLYYGTGEPISRDLTWVVEQVFDPPRGHGGWDAAHTWANHTSRVEKILNEFFVLKDDGWHRSSEDQTRERLIGGDR